MDGNKHHGVQCHGSNLFTFAGAGALPVGRLLGHRGNMDVWDGKVTHTMAVGRSGHQVHSDPDSS